MEWSESLGFDSAKGARKARTFASRKRRAGSSQDFLSDYIPEFVSPSTSSRYEIPGTHGGSSSENPSRFSDKNGNDRGVSEMNYRRRGSSADYNHLGGETMIVEENFQQSPDKISDTSEGNTDKDDFETLKIVNLKELNFKKPGKLVADAEYSEGVLPAANISSSDWRRQPDAHKFERVNKLVKRAKRSSVEYDLSEADLKRYNISDQSNRATKVKLKVGGITHTLQANHSGSSSIKPQDPVGYSSKPHEPSSTIRHEFRLISKEKNDNELECIRRMTKHGFAASKSRTGKQHSREGSRSKSSEESASPKRPNDHVANIPTFQPLRKSSRVPKRRMLDGEHSDDDNKDEVSYEKNNASKRNISHSLNDRNHVEETSIRRSSRIPRRKVIEEEYDSQYENYCAIRGNKNSKKKLVMGKISAESIDDSEESAASSNGDVSSSDLKLDVKRKKNIKQQLVGSFFTDKKEIPLTARQRALKSVKETVPKTASRSTKFRDGLLQTEKKKQKETIPDLEQQLKKDEAAQRRRIQVEKMAKEIQAEAVRKILGNDPNRETRREKHHKKQIEKAKEKAAASIGFGSNTIRWVMGPNGTTVSFSEDAGLPSIFSSTTCRYPPPREKCAGPSCTNAYKYRDSKSNLPLCSLQCYRAVNDKMQPLTTC